MATTTVASNNKHSAHIMHLGGEVIDPLTYFRFSDTVAPHAEANLQSNGNQTITFIWSTAGVNMHIKSSDAADDSGGTGAITVRVYGFDSSYNLVYEDATLNGTAGVDLTALFITNPIFCKCLTFGSGHTNAGHISITNHAENAYYAGIDLGQNVGGSGYIYIPSYARIGVVDFTAWLTVATTDYDGITIKVYEVDLTDTAASTLIYSASWGDTIKLGSQSFHDSVHLERGHMYKITAIEIGTTAQTLNFSVARGWGY